MRVLIWGRTGSASVAIPLWFVPRLYWYLDSIRSLGVLKGVSDDDPAYLPCIFHGGNPELVRGSGYFDC